METLTAYPLSARKRQKLQTGGHVPWRWLASRVRPLGLILAGLCLFSLALVAVLGGSDHISGKVVSAETMMPVEDALVYVNSGMSYEEVGLNIYSRTDSKGKFKAKVRGTVSVRVWKPGYAIRSVNLGPASDATGRENILELRPLTSSNWIKEHDDFVELKYGSGFSFRLGKVVSGDSADADLVLTKDVTDETNAYVVALGEGGIIFQSWDEKVDFDNSPAAPLTGYERSEKLNRPEQGLYFLRTRDGKHYAKFRLLIGVVESPDGSTHLELNESRFIWAYQPDGTRNLEIGPSRKLSFPLEEFGIKRDSLPIQ